MKLYIFDKPIRRWMHVKVLNGKIGEVVSWNKPTREYPNGYIIVNVDSCSKRYDVYKVWGSIWKHFSKSKEATMGDFKFVITKQCDGVQLKKLRGRAIFIHGDSFYRVVDEIGQGIQLNKSPNMVMVTNQKIGTLRLLDGNIHVIPLKPCEGSEEIRLTEVPKDEMFRYTK